MFRALLLIYLLTVVSAWSFDINAFIIRQYVQGLCLVFTYSAVLSKSSIDINVFTIRLYVQGPCFLCNFSALFPYIIWHYLHHLVIRLYVQRFFLLFIYSAMLYAWSFGINAFVIRQYVQGFCSLFIYSDLFIYSAYLLTLPCLHQHLTWIRL